MQTHRKKRMHSGIWPYLLLAPALIIMLSVVIVPIINAVSMSFQSYNLTRPKKIAFIGFDNYVKLFNDKLFWVMEKLTFWLDPILEKIIS